uniref:Secreted protein n=1 Tax=Acrobeloides nanus TaxID=290746 RepID=A0A914CNP9_9BILA
MLFLDLFPFRTLLTLSQTATANGPVPLQHWWVHSHECLSSCPAFFITGLFLAKPDVPVLTIYDEEQKQSSFLITSI